MQIRPATSDDLDRVVEMGLAFISSTRYAALFAGEPGRIRELAKVLLEHGVILLADVDGRLEGMLGIFLARHEFSEQLIASEIAWWVEPSARKSSIGPRLLCAAEEWARHMGASMLKMVAPSKTDIGAYYERRGFVLTETVYIKTL